MKKQLLLGLIPVFAISLLSFANPTDTKITEGCAYLEYCAGYADGKEEAAKVMTMEEWTAIKDGCIARRCPGY